MFRALLCPSSGARECNVDYHIGRLILGLLQVGGSPAYSHLTANLQQPKKETTNVVINITQRYLGYRIFRLTKISFSFFLDSANECFSGCAR
jgi:hypothetical protein